MYKKVLKEFIARELDNRCRDRITTMGLKLHQDSVRVTFSGTVILYNKGIAESVCGYIDNGKVEVIYADNNENWI